MALTNDEKSLAAQLGFDVDVAAFLKNESDGPVLPFDPTHESRTGLAVKVSDGNAAELLINKIQPVLTTKGYRSFWTDLREENGSKTGWAVAVLKSLDHFAILDAVKLCPETHSGPEVVWDKLKSYEKLCNLEIVGAAPDWVAVKFTSLPADLCAFAEDVYLFCPDSCDLNSGIGSRSDSTQDRLAAKNLCPETSENFNRLHKERFGRIGDLSHVPAELLSMMPPYEMLLEDAQWSVRLLAAKLKREMYFFFWWD